MEPKLSSQQMLLDICSMVSRAKDLLKEEKSYHTLLNAITNIGYCYDDTQHLPSLKELSAQTELKYDLVRRQLRQIYKDLLPDVEKAMPFHFIKVLYTFHLKGWTRSIWFDADTLPVVPRVGENINVPFFKAYVGTDYFYVAEINHTLQDTHQLIDIMLKQGRYNSYWHFRKDQAAEEGEIGFSEYVSEDDYTLKKKLFNKPRRW